MRFHLDPSDLVARGKNREIYRHPTDDGLLIKVLKEGRRRREAERGPIARRFRPSYMREFMVEIEAVFRAHKRAPATLRRLPIIQAAGLVATNLGMGQLVERIAGVDGGLAPTLADLLAEGRFDTTALGRLNGFVEQMYALHVVAEDVDPRNIVWDATSDSFVLIDGFGEKPVVPIHVWSKTINDMQLDLAFRKRLAGRTALEWDMRARRFHF